MSGEPTDPSNPVNPVNPSDHAANGNGRVAGNGRSGSTAGADDGPTEVDAAIDAELAAIEALAVAGEGDATGAGSAGAAAVLVDAEETAFEKAQRESADDTPPPQEPRTGMIRAE